MAKQPEQLYFDGTAPPPDPTRTPELDAKLWAWLESRDEQRRVGEKRKDHEHLLMHALVEAGIEKYPYLDPSTQKKRFFVADKTPKAKTVSAHEPKMPKPKKRDAEEIAKREETEANRVEQRRVSRASVDAELAERDEKIRKADSKPKRDRGGDNPTHLEPNEDPFARVRGLLDDASKNETEH